MLIVVVGPSGSGKDSLIAYARERMRDKEGILFVRRVITRQALATAEDHDTMSAQAFAAAQAAGAFAVTWQAHGLSYAIPASAERHVAEGGIAVVNGSRAALAAISAVFARMRVVHVTCRPEILAARLAARGRESAAEREKRLTRAVGIVDHDDVAEIENSGELRTGGDALVRIITAATKGEAAFGSASRS